MAAFPNTFAPRIDAEADAVAQRPHANHAIEMAAGSGYSRRHNIRIVVNVDRSRDSRFLQRVSHQIADMRAFELFQVGRIFDEAFADDAWKADANRIHFLIAG